MANRLLAGLRHRRLIFTVTSGRSGTKLLAEVLQLLPGVHAEHEPYPYVDNIWWRMRHDPHIARRWLVQTKLPAILKSMADTNTNTYVETSHMMCKGFFEPMHALGIDFDIILLSRDLRDTARSLYSLGNIPVRTKAGRRWLLDLEDSTNISQLPKRDWSDYQLVYWYVLEMELRKEHYWDLWVSTFRKAARLNMHEITNLRDFREFLSFMDLPTIYGEEQEAKYNEIVGIRHNTKYSTKSHARYRGIVDAVLHNLDDQEQEVKEAIGFDKSTR
jgi:hypothetical protein